MRAIVALMLAVVLSACRETTSRSRPAFRGPLRSLVDSVPVSLDACTLSARTYLRPFWRAPYRDCHIETVDGWQFVELDADTVVVETARMWTVAPFQQDAAWRREAERLTTAFGPPGINRPPDEVPRVGTALLRSFCAASAQLLRGLAWS